MQEPGWSDRDRLRAAGWTDAVIDGALRSHTLSAVVRGVHVPAAIADDLSQRCGAALSTQHPEAAITRRTAAVALRFPWLPDEWQAQPICVDGPRQDTSRSARRGLDRRTSLLPDEDVRLWRGLRITSPARTAVDLARFEPRRLAVPVLDGLLTAERCTLEELLAVTDRMYRVPGVRRARGFVDLARPGVGSPRETHIRLHMLDAGLPQPDVNLEILEDGIVLAQGDLGYWRWLIWIEYDGAEFHGQRRFDGVDQNKDRWLNRRGWQVLRLTNSDHHYPALFLSEVRAAIRDAPARIAALDPQRSPEIRAAQQLLGLRPTPRLRPR